MDETLDRIHELSNERLTLYRLAAKQRLTFEQKRWLDELNYRLPILWDTHRRELAASKQPIRLNRAAQPRAA